jgi:hypothetical protein
MGAYEKACPEDRNMIKTIESSRNELKLTKDSLFESGKNNVGYMEVMGGVEDVLDDFVQSKASYKDNQDEIEWLLKERKARRL